MNELRDKVVMVHPTLTHDPVNMQGHMAKIISVDTAKDEVMVRFKNQMLGLYEANALLMLIPGMEILDKLRSDSEDMERYDLLDILGIYLLDAAGAEKYKREALDMAMSRATLMHATVISVQDYIDLKRDFGENVEQTRGR
jgi:hypothetical protein